MLAAAAFRRSATRSGVSPLLKKVQVVDLVSYGEDFDVVKGGYSETEATMNDDVPF